MPSTSPILTVSSQSGPPIPSAPPWVRRWTGDLLLGVWLSVTAVWPMGLVPVGKTLLMWQPLLLLTLAILVLIRHRREGWGPVIGRSLWMFAVFTMAAWLPLLYLPASLRGHPAFYHAYLLLYEGGLAMLVGWQAARAASRAAPSWWTSGGWSRPLVVAPVLLIVRGVQTGHWAAALVGVVLGVSVAVLGQSRRWSLPRSPRFWQFVPVGLFIGAMCLVWGSSFRIYSLTGLSAPGTQAGFPAASDDGPAYYELGVNIANDPRLLFTSKLGDQEFFTGYSVLMGLWFWLLGGGPHMPSWLMWHGVAGGLLAVAVYGIGVQLTGQAIWGVVAGVAAVADHIMLQLLSTINQETFFFACVYWALLLWSQAAHNPAVRPRGVVFAGLVLGASVVCRATSLLLPLVWYLCLSWERPRSDAWSARKQGGLLLLGFAIPVGLMIIRQRIAWGYWSVAGTHAEQHIIGWNYALRLHGVHLTDVGVVAWLRMLAAEPHLLWQHVIPSWWEQGVYQWTHRGFGQMDLVQGLNDAGPYQAALTTILTVSALVGAGMAIRRRTRLDLTLLCLPLYFTSFVLLYYVLNSRYRSPFIPALYLFSCVGLSLAATRARTREAAA